MVRGVFDFLCKRVSSLFTKNVMLMNNRKADHHVVRMHNMQGKSLFLFPFSWEFVGWLSGTSAERCFPGCLSEALLRLLRIGKFVLYVFYGLSQGLGQLFGASLGKISGSLRMNSLENWSKSQCFRLPKQFPQTIGVHQYLPFSRTSCVSVYYALAERWMFGSWRP